MLVLIVFMGIIALVVAGIIALLYYMEGRTDSEGGYAYGNDHGGMAAWLYDLGYNAAEAADGRATTNRQKNRERREARG